MINITMIDTGQRRDNKPVYAAKFGDSDIINVVAEDEHEAEEKLMFMLIYELRGKTIDFNPEDIPEKKTK